MKSYIKTKGRTLDIEKAANHSNWKDLVIFQECDI